jgi:hypothetical protein
MDRRRIVGVLEIVVGLFLLGLAGFIAYHVGPADGQVRPLRANPLPSSTYYRHGPATERVRGLVALWKFDEGGGTIAYDSVSNNRGTLVNGPTWTSGRISSALSFDGTDDYVEVGDSPKLEGMDNLTICAWIRPQQNPGQDNVIIVDKVCYTAYRFHVYDVDRADGTGLLTSWINGNTCAPTPDVELEMSGSNWYHVVLVYDNNNNEVRYYIDGSLAGTKPLASGAIGTNSAPLRIARSNHPTPQYFRGIIDDVRIYDRALSAEEIWQLYQQGL